MDTIFALSTAPGKAGVAVIRVSGPGAWAAGDSLCGTLPSPGDARLRNLRDSSGQLLDQALVLHFSQGHSFTGEDVVELHCHGSPAIVAAILDQLGTLPGLRLADPGEFTRRALENGCLDLAQVEGLSDLIEAETEAQRKQAVRVFSGKLGELAETWRRDLIRAAALLEATIDFADEEVPEDVTPEVQHLLARVKSTLSQQITGVSAAERIRCGFEVAIIGAPNVGKSTLLNALAGREAAITSEYAGTTRDVIELRMDLKGLPVTFLDTAGLRASDDVVEQIGIDRARQRAEQADLRIFLVDYEQVIDIKRESDDIMVYSKADLLDGPANAISGKTGQGVPELINAVTDILKERSAHAGVATHMRHRQAMERAVIYIEQADAMMEQGFGQSDLIAEELRSAIRALDTLVGRVDVEAVLDEIFASFCLGK